MSLQPSWRCSTAPSHLSRHAMSTHNHITSHCTTQVYSLVSELIPITNATKGDELRDAQHGRVCFVTRELNTYWNHYCSIRSSHTSPHGRSSPLRALCSLASWAPSTLSSRQPCCPTCLPSCATTSLSRYGGDCSAVPVLCATNFDVHTQALTLSVLLQTLKIAGDQVNYIVICIYAFSPASIQKILTDLLNFQAVAQFVSKLPQVDATSTNAELLAIDISLRHLYKVL